MKSIDICWLFSLYRVTLVAELPVGHLNRASITRVSAMRTPFALGTLKVTMDAVVAMDSEAMAISVKVRFHRRLISTRTLK